MRKIVATIVALQILLSSFAMAASGAPGSATLAGAPGASYSQSDDIIINGYASIHVISYSVVDEFAYCEAGQRSHEGYTVDKKSSKGLRRVPTDWDAHKYSTKWYYAEAGSNEQYACLKATITNLSTTDVRWSSGISVNVVYDDTYTYTGWIYEYDYNRSPDVVFAQSDIASLKPLHSSDFLIGATLPKSVTTANGSLEIVVTMDCNEWRYKVR